MEEQRQRQEDEARRTVSATSNETAARTTDGKNVKTYLSTYI